MIKLLGTANEQREKAEQIIARHVRGLGERENLSGLMHDHLSRRRTSPLGRHDTVLSVIVQEITDTPSAPVTQEEWTAHFVRIAMLRTKADTFMSDLLIELYSYPYSEMKRAAAIDAAIALS